MEIFKKMDNRIKYIKIVHSGGAAKPKNQGIRASRGEYIAVLDSDDEWMPTKLEEQVNFFKADLSQNIGFVGCDMLIVDEKKKQQYYWKTKFYENVLGNILVEDYMGSGSCMLYKKAVFDKVGYFDERLTHAQDWEMRIRLCQKYRFGFVDKALVRYYLHKGSVTSSLNYNTREKDLMYIYDKWKKVYSDNPGYNCRRIAGDGIRFLKKGKIRKALGFFAKALKISPVITMHHMAKKIIKKLITV